MIWYSTNRCQGSTEIRSIAFQVPEELFQKIKDYLQRNNMTQKEFMLGLIENEIERDLAQRAAEAPENTEEVTEDNDEQEEAAVSDDSAEDPEEVEEEYEEQDNSDFEGVSDDESEDLDEDSNEELDEDESLSEEVGISMAM